MSFGSSFEQPRVANFFSNQNYVEFVKDVVDIEIEMCGEDDNCPQGVLDLLNNVREYPQPNMKLSPIELTQQLNRHQNVPPSDYFFAELKGNELDSCTNCIRETLKRFQGHLTELPLGLVQSQDIGFLYYILSKDSLAELLPFETKILDLNIMTQWIDKRTKGLKLLENFDDNSSDLLTMADELPPQDELGILIDSSSRLHHAQHVMDEVFEKHTILSNLDDSICVKDNLDSNGLRICKNITLVNKLYDNLAVVKSAKMNSQAYLEKRIKSFKKLSSELISYIQFKVLQNRNDVNLFNHYDTLIKQLDYQGKVAYSIAKKMVPLANDFGTAYQVVDSFILANPQAMNNMDIINRLVVNYGFRIELLGLLDLQPSDDAAILKSTVLFVNGYNKAAEKVLTSRNLSGEKESRLLAAYIASVNGNSTSSTRMLISIINDNTEQKQAALKLTSNLILKGFVEPTDFASIPLDDYKNILNGAVSQYQNAGLFSSELRAVNSLILVEESLTVKQALLRKGVEIAFKENLKTEYAQLTHDYSQIIANQDDPAAKAFAATHLVNLAHAELTQNKLNQAKDDGELALALNASFDGYQLLYSLALKTQNTLDSVLYAYSASTYTDTESVKKDMLTNSVFYMNIYLENNRGFQDKANIKSKFVEILDVYLTKYDDKENIQGVYSTYLKLQPDPIVWLHHGEISYLPVNEQNLDLLYGQKFVDGNNYRRALELFECAEKGVFNEASIASENDIKSKIEETKLKLYRSNVDFERLRLLASSASNVQISDAAIVDIIKLKNDKNARVLLKTLLEYRIKHVNSSILTNIERHIMNIYEEEGQYKKLATFSSSVTGMEADYSVELLQIAANANERDDSIEGAVNSHLRIVESQITPLSIKIVSAKYVLDHPLSKFEERRNLSLLNRYKDITMDKSVKARLEYVELNKLIGEELTNFESGTAKNLNVLRSALDFNKEMKNRISVISRVGEHDLDSRVLDLKIKLSSLLHEQMQAVLSVYKDKPKIKKRLIGKINSLNERKRKSISDISELVSRNYYDFIINEYVNDKI